MIKNRFFPRIITIMTVLSLLSGCADSTMTVSDKNGKQINVISSDNTYTFKLPVSEPAFSEVWENPYADIKEDAWYYDAVKYCCENHLTLGLTENTFGPDKAASRSMIVYSLWKLKGSPYKGINTFTDVDDAAYYADAVAWAASENIISGYSAELFGPDDEITREQFASVLYRFAQYNGWNTTKGSLDKYIDADTISEYALPALSWATEHQIINGMADSLLTPQGNTTRAQMAAIFMNICENYEK